MNNLSQEETQGIKSTRPALGTDRRKDDCVLNPPPLTKRISFFITGGGENEFVFMDQQPQRQAGSAPTTFEPHFDNQIQQNGYRNQTESKANLTEHKAMAGELTVNQLVSQLGGVDGQIRITAIASLFSCSV